MHTAARNKPAHFRTTGYKRDLPLTGVKSGGQSQLKEIISALTKRRLADGIVENPEEIMDMEAVEELFGLISLP